eukprot:Blabericola_migrator_1__5923@NODE_299_length_10197_cov_100_341955_g246_i0_p1_GENE_NODE_299_length_10197_cov_100_341955_g246_i0NODE_299_length_10197_cov_100_341955_g246_i0_p1_ORF_typecomplete_len1549_score344_02RRM_1/PF00076_22/6_1e14RRM_1/PF00076_22/1_5RRM_1/PF00076_22/1_8e03RRM_1/PF00076_22/4_9e19RRM_5/PF13893_6/2_2RRM_5/PF13893_6/1_7e09RRM_Rrp7/PF17799_1/42RRM_Rrp7/PF17799_1/0_00016RRM_Rrp7/PF17799_1/0_14RRM_2/PF04059_12/2_9RRM_2/PF04059_12/70RRM_2/PF04059_12/3_4e02RRM_2/PF04059_12/0_15RRM_occ
MTMKWEDEESIELQQLKTNDLLERYKFHGASLRLVEEICVDLIALEDVEGRRKLFERAVLLAAVNRNFFEGFFQDRLFLTTFRSGRDIFKAHYLASILTASPSLWTEVLRLAVLPHVDFEMSDLLAPSGVLAPVLFHSPDLYLGVADFPTSLSLVNHLMRARWLSDTPEMQETSPSIMELSAMTQLVLSALSIAAAHCTQGPPVWTAVRIAAQDALKELLEKYGVSPLSSQEPSTATVDTSAGVDTGGAGVDVSATVDTNGLSGVNIERPIDMDLVWQIWCESWRVRCLYYRQLCQPSLNLPDLIDEYKLFELEIPEEFRAATHVPKAFLNGHMSIEDLRETVCSTIINKDTEGKKQGLKQCVQLADKLLAWSEKRWKARRRFETMASSMDDVLVMPENEKLSGTTDTQTTTTTPPSVLDMTEILDSMDDDALEAPSDLCNTKQSFHLWTEYINFEEAEATRLSEFAKARQKHDVSSDDQSSESHTHGTQIDLIKFTHDTLLHNRSRVVAQKRRAATVYMRAIEAVGDLRLDLFAAFWDFLQRTGQDTSTPQSSQWLTHWLWWCADQAVRKHPLKSCCWAKAFEVAKKKLTAEVDSLASFVQGLCQEETGVFWKCLMAPAWFKIDEVLPPPIRLDFPLDFSIASDETCSTHTSEFLHCVCEVLRSTEEAFRLYFSQNRLFQGANQPDAESCNELFACVELVVSLVNEKLISIVQYLSSGQDINKNPLATTEGRPLTQALFTALLNVHIYRGVSMARLNQSFESLSQLFIDLDEISNLFLEFFKEGDMDNAHNNMTALIWNVKISLLLTNIVCSDIRYFNNIRGSWINTHLIRGELCPRVISHTFTEQTFDTSFELLFDRLANDTDGFSELKQRPHLVDKILILSAAAGLASEALRGKHKSELLFEWVSNLQNSLTTGTQWNFPDEFPAYNEIQLLPTTQLPPPSTFPKLGVPVHIALCELQSRPFSLSSKSAHSPGDQLLDLASISSSSSDSSSSAAVDVIVNSHKYTSPKTSLAPKPPESPHPPSPSRRLSAEDIEKLTRATRDGREAPLPSLAPSAIPATLPHDIPHTPHTSDTANRDFPPARSPVIMTGRKRSLTGTDLYMLPKSSSEPSNETSDEGSFVRLGNHHLQQKLVEGGGNLTTLIGHMIEWKTLYVSNLEAEVTQQQLESELQSCDCIGVKEVRLVCDKKGKSKGFAYIDFDTSDNAKAAEEKFNGRSINGLKVKALISVPKNPVYEEKTVFVSNIPKDCTKEALMDVLTGLASRPEFQVCVNVKKRAGGDTASLRSNAKRLKAEAHGDENSMADGSQDMTSESQDLNPQLHQNNTVQPWQVLDVRMFSKQGASYGYVDMDSMQSTVRLLEASSQHPELFTVNGSKLIIAPSVPKQDGSSKVRAPVAKSSKSGTRQVSEDDKRLRRTLHVSNLSWKVTQSELTELFKSYGPVVKCHLAMDPQRKSRNLGFAFVEMENDMDALAAMSASNGKDLGGRQISVQQSSRVITEKKEADKTKQVKEVSGKPKISLTTTSHKQRHQSSAVPTSNEEFRKLLLNR